MDNVKELLAYINPAELTYQEWINVGMAMKHEGLTAFDWDTWSRDDVRYKPGECWRKWDTFSGSSEPVTGGTLYEYARRGGYVPESEGPGIALDWDSEIAKEKKDDLKVVDAGWLEDQDIEEPGANWDPVHDLITYLQTLFQSTENVGYVTDVYENEDRLSPKKGNWDRTAGQLIEELRKCHGDIGKVIGDWNKQAGAWIRFNPLDGNGIKNENVTDYRYALVESDSVPIAKQNAIIRELELPVACLVYSGGKSIHAIVKINAGDYQDYKRRVEYLYRVCDKNGLKVDTQNKNPSRLSRLPGVTRNGHKQFLIGTNLGRKSWEEWQEWIDGVNDDLPDPEDIGSVLGNLPPLADELISGVLRKGHKLLLAGPSKAGKSFALIELCIAIAQGGSWLGFKCAEGRVLYVNLELDRASCLHRFRDVYASLHIDNPKNNIDIWNLRGKSVPMDKLAPKLIRRAYQKNYTAVIIDPIYKVITGDENSADQMAAFCNQFDKICTQLQAAVIYCHHHSKGAQGGKKSMDRASGSGVFARDPDALLDLSELELTDGIKKLLEDKARIRGYRKALDEFSPGWMSLVSQDDLLNATVMQSQVDSSNLSAVQRMRCDEYVAAEVSRIKTVTGWRIEGTLREFAPFEPLNLWFDYPIHHIDREDVLKAIEVDDGQSWKKKQQEKGAETTDVYIKAIKDLMVDGVSELHYSEIAEALGKDAETVRMDLSSSKRRHKRRLEKEGYVYKRGMIQKKPNNEVNK